jgi:hypothetical protein
MRPVSQVFLGSFLLVSGMWGSGCAGLAPQVEATTTGARAPSPVKLDPGFATVVIVHPTSDGRLGVAPDELPTYERLQKVRVVDGDGRVVTELRRGEHAIVSVAPGTYDLATFDLSGAHGDHRCVGAARLRVAPGRAYALAVEHPRPIVDTKERLRAACGQELAPVSRAAWPALAQRLAEVPWREMQPWPRAGHDADRTEHHVALARERFSRGAFHAVSPDDAVAHGAF